MTTDNGFDLIVRRQRSRSKRDVVFGFALVVLATFGLGTLTASARTADFRSAAPITTTAR